jgi:hypothetical protein
VRKGIDVERISEMMPLFAGVLEGALIGAVVGLVVGILMMLLRPAKPCPECRQPLPKPFFSPIRACPKCGCKLNAKGEKLDEGR